MKILHVVGRMNMGGAETFLMNILRNIDRSKNQFIFLCYFDGSYDYEEEIRHLGGKIVRIADTRTSNPLRFVKDIEKVIRDEQIDIVHSHVDFSSGYAMLAAKNASVGIRIAHAHSASTSPSANAARIIWLKILKQVMIVNSTNLVACGDAAGRFMFGDKPFQVIRNGINIQRFEFSTSVRSTMRKKLGISENDTVLLHIGRFEAVKNHTFLIDVFAAYRSMDSSARLILLGDGRLIDDVKSQIEALGLGDCVYLMGNQGNTEDYYSASDVFVMPSLYEGLPVTLIEAQANGLQCLVSDGIDKASSYGLIDFFPLEKSADDWSRRIKKHSKHKRGPANRQLVQEYSINEVIKQLERIYGSK